MNKYMLTRFICWLPLLMLSPLVLAQTPQMPLPACTAEIVDTDGRDEAIGDRNIDVDSDGLIEIYDLESLNEMRYQLDGSGHKTSASASKNTKGCPESGCIGYELVKDLDFKVADSYRDNIVDTTWTTSTGWQPIGSVSNRFSGVFEGNGFMIANLYINRNRATIGLFEVTAETAKINNIKLSNVNVQGGNNTGSLVGDNHGSIISIDVVGTVNGNSFVGGLVGANKGHIISSFANAMVTASQDGVGGLVGFNNSVIRESGASGNVMGAFRAGGLTGENSGSISSSYATGSVTGTNGVPTDLVIWTAGGLVGQNRSSGSITNSYATGTVSGNNVMGGLVGDMRGVVKNSYAIGQVLGSDDNDNLLWVGGFYGIRFGGMVIESYWDTETSMQARRNDFEANLVKTTAEMQSPTGPGTTTTEIYYGWSEEVWDFGGISDYPVLSSAASSGTVISAVAGSMPYDVGIEVAIDVDKDGDGLIEICDLEGLDEMRYQLDGSGYKASAAATKLTQGCPESGCIGYELVKDLDFDVDDSYRTISNKVTWADPNAAGWPPIGSNKDRFSGVFEGNGHTIANLHINRGTVAVNIGLFAVTADIAKINNIKLPDVNVKGGNYTSSLVGFNHGSIISSNVTGTVLGISDVGGLVGKNTGQIIFSFANVTVMSMKVDGINESGDYIGGLVGWNEGSIANTYAIGDVSGNDKVGGLVGLQDAGKITNSYAIGKPSGAGFIGGLVGNSINNSVVTASYWDTDTTEQETSDGGTSKTTVQLQSPLAPGFAETDTYYGWGNEVWYFGSTNTYPVLRFTVDADGDGILDGDADNRVDIDQDGDGLIEIYDLEGLNEMRYQLDGSGYRASAHATKITRGCPATGCRGYELMKDLDFKTDDSYRSAASNKTAWTDPNVAGWQPIGDESDGFLNSVLEGNGHTIAHLYINRSDEGNVGLLALVAANAQVQNIRLVNVNVKGDAQTGSLAGANEGIIINVRVTGTVSARIEVGGLTGHNANQIISSFANVTVTASQDYAGGLVGGNSITNVGSTAFISESGASGNVMGSTGVGGLSGRNFGNIINSYATGSATGRDSVGGLVGLCNTNCIIANSYAAGAVIGTSTVGGLVGDHSGLAIASYWDTQTSDQAASPGGDPKTTAELQSPTAPGATAMATYYGWSADIWDFGNNTEYPLLRVSVADPDRDGDLVVDVTDIDDDNDGLIEIHTIDDLHEMRHQLDGSGKKQNAGDANNTTGCPRSGCIGYELARSLDFNDVNSYRDYRINTDWTVANYADDNDHGWHPLPAFSAVFNGNGHIIRNLQINRVNHNDAGLFGVLHQTGRIEHVELVYPNVRGQSNVGGLVGNNNGVISNSYVRDYDTNPNSRDSTKLIEAIEGSVGGLVGRNNGGGTNNIGYVINSGAVINVQIKQNTSDDGISANAGGLVGFNINGAEIRNSYARGAVKGPCGVGGLTANNFSSDNVDPDKNSKIINSYSSGNVTTGFGNCDDGGNVRSGGLAAINGGLISNSYTTSCWAGGTASVPSGRRGGVVQNNSGAINNSYYQATGCSGLQETPSGSNRLQFRLRQRPTTSNHYSEWSVNEWDFGTSNQYPLIRYTVGSDKDNPECGTLSLSACNALIKHQGRTATDEGSPAANPSFVSGSIVTSIDPVTNVGAFILQPPQFNLANSNYKLYVQDSRTNPSDEMKVDLIYGSSYELVNCLPTADACGNTKATFTIDRSRTFEFNIKYKGTNPDTVYSPFSLEVIPIVASPFDAHVTVNSEVNEEPATFIDGVIRVEEGDTVRMNVADGFIVQGGINLPLSYHWYSSSGPTLISGELRGQSISFTIDDTMFRDSGSGDAIVTLEVRDASGTTATPVIQEIPIRISGRLSLTSDAAEVMRDEADKTLHRVVLASDQPQAIITARALNETLTVDDSAAQVSAENGDGTSLASEITVQLEVGNKVEFDITATDSDNNVTTHTVRVFRRSGAVSLQDIEIADITFDKTISAPGSYVGMLPIGIKGTTITRITLTAGETNAISIVTVRADQDGDGTSSISRFIADKDFAAPGEELTLTRSSGTSLLAGGAISLTIRTRDAYIDETQVSATLADLPYNEGVYTITIESTQPIDNDNDGLIDIYTLDDLDEMRNQYSNMPSTCGSNGNITCEGFELRQSLDFNAADSYQDNTVNTAWTTGFGWAPILASDLSYFNRVFEGNGFTILGLYIDDDFGLGRGLFFGLGNDGVIKNVGLLDVSIRGSSVVGSLVGENQGTIINSYVTSATIVGGRGIGGLIGDNSGTIINSYATTATIVGDSEIGGLIGRNIGTIISSFAYADVTGSTGKMGGLVGVNGLRFSVGFIANTYAAGTVASTQTVVSAGGLVGVNTNISIIRNSYTISQVMPLTGSSQVGGLVGLNDASIIASYWDKTVNADLTTSDGAKTTAELQNPTAPGVTSADTYHGWNTDAWDFGDRIHYPNLYYVTTDSTVSACADSTMPSSALPRCGSRIPNQAVRNLIPDLPALEVSEITMSSQPAASADGTINEGSNVSLMVNATGESESYSYTWSQTSGRTLELENSTGTTLSFTIPSDFVELNATTAVITFQVAVSDGSLTTSRSAIITINKINNGNPTIAVDVDVNAARLRIIATASDTDGAGSFSYQWQQLVSGGWMDITAATTATYWLPADEEARIQYRVKVKHTDGQGYTTDYPIQGPFRVRLDDDNDGLIDIYTLEDLDAIRNQYRNIPSRCGSSGNIACDGFELRRSLDFNAAESYQSGMTDPNWTTSTGWMPIGSDVFNDLFNRVFEGNGHTISGLYINRPQSSNVGLFGVSHSEIKNIGLLDVNIQGGNDTGGLVGVSYGNIINSYASGAVSGSSHVGGLVGHNEGRAIIINSHATGAVTGTGFYIGGLVGWNQPDAYIINSYASGAVSGRLDVGGLVGFNHGRLRNTYATGDVSLTGESDNDLGGLVGEWVLAGSIRNSYAIGRVIPGADNARDAGGLIGNTTGTVVSSYWDGEASGWNISAGGVTSRTTMELQSPTAPGATAMDVYYGWRDNDWDFGSSEEYPALRYVAGGMNACNADILTVSDLPQCGSLLPNQGRTAVFALAVSEVTLSSQPEANVDGTINEESNVSLMVNVTEGSGVYNYVWSQTSGKALSLTTTDTVTLNVAIVPDFVEQDATTAAITFQVDVNDGISTISRSAIITIKKINNGIPAIAVDVDVNAARLRIIATAADTDGAGSFSYQWQQLVSGGWMDITAATTATYWLPADADDRIQYRVEVKHTDGQGYTTEYPIQGPFRVRFDDDNDGLIDIYTLEDLDAIRNQYLNIPDRCGSTGDIVCNGFELRRSLDFNAVESYQSSTINTVWTTGRGWLPIGLGDSTGFGSVFEGNGYTLSGLYINSSNSGMALFFVLNATGQIKNVGLLDVDMRGSWNTAGLVAANNGSIINSYATGKVSGSSGNIGGLVGENGYTGSIRSSFAKVRVSGRFQVGGLVGLHTGRITNSYAAGTVSATSTGDASVGGLVGGVGLYDGEIINSYAVGRVISSGGSNVGGLVGKTTGTVIVSYWDTQTSKQSSGAGGDGAIARSTVQLQSPTAAGTTSTDTYYSWSDKVWDFGDDEDYPALRYIAGGMNACTTDILTLSDLPQCGSLLPNQGRTAVFAVSEVMISSQPVVNNDGTINEGSNVSLRVNVIGGSGEYNFVWSQTSGQAVVLTTTNTAILNVAIAPDLIAEDLLTTTLTFTVMVDDGMSSIMRSKMITITKIDNGNLVVEVDVNSERLRIISTGADPDGSSGVFSYQWQKQELGGEWENIEDATTATYVLPADASASVRYRVTISYTDDQGYPTEYQSRSFRGSLDDDGDGLIDIYTLEDLDDIRNQYASMPSTCAAGNAEQCRGFELRRSLDFNAVESYQSNTINTVWTTGRGWMPIGFGNATAFGSLFDGNGYTLSGLQIDNSDNGVALFSAVGATGQINNIGLLDVAVSGRSNVGSLVGENYGRIINSYATGEVVGSNGKVGGLVGLNGYTGSILSSFAAAEVSGSEAVGGLVGWHTGRITNSYAAGTASLTATSGLALGGLVGQVGANDGAIINSYAISRVMPGVDNARDVGGLVGVTTGTVIASYWNTQTSEQASSAGGDGAIPRTTVQLQSATAPGLTAMDSYYGWDDKIWDFGDNNHYPALRYTGGSLDACNDDITRSSMRPLCGIPLPQQSDRDKGLAILLVTVGDDDISERLMPTFSPLRVNYEMLIVSTATEVQLTLRPYALNPNAMIAITDQDGSNYFSGKPNAALSDPIMLSEQTTLTIVVTDNIAESMVDTTYILTISKITPLAISGVMLSATTIAEGSTATVTFDVSGGTGIYQYAYKLIADEDEITLPSLAPPAVLMMPIDIVAAADSERAVELNIIVSDGSGRSVKHDAALTIEKVDNGLANIEASRATSRTVTVKVGGDPDGDADDPNYAYQWQWRAAEATAQWVTIAGEEDASYTIIDDLAVINNEFRVQVMYTDGQGYQATLISNAVRYDFLPPCTMAIADSDGDGVGATIDIDKDGDGLIELCDLEGLNEMRYQLDGNGYKTSEGATSSRRGCPLVDGEEHCRGYELMQSLDFNEVASYRENTLSSAWTAGSGWLPIDAGFASVFEGNGHSIVNLSINRTEAASGSEQGLFSTLATTAQINNIQLLDVNIKGFAQVAALSGSNSGIIRNSSASGEVMANSDVGGLVGRNDGSVVSSDADVAVTANMNGGGLVGHNQGSLSDSQAFGEVMGGSRLGGLSGVNDGLIISSYATATVNGTDTSSDDMGGLVGHNNNVIANSYATGAVSATGNNIGGLVGFNNNGRIVNTYAEGSVMGASQVGGLIGRHHGSLRDSYVALGAVSGSGSDIGGLIGIINTTATVIASYWDSEESGQASSAGGESKTTAELQTATAPGTTTTAVYYNWSDNDWDFGDSSHYPALRYASDDDLNSCAIDITTSTMALPCTILLPSQRDRDKGLATIFFFSDDSSATVTAEPLFSPLTNSYMVTIVTRAERVRLTLRPYAINADATITVTDPTDTSYFADKLNGALSDEIPLVAETTVTIVVSDILGEDTVHTTYTFAITSELPPLIVSDLSLSLQPPANTDGTINEGSTATLTFNVSGGTGVYQYTSQIDEAAYTSFVPPFIYSIADDFIAADATTQTVTLTIRVSDQADKIEDFEYTEVLHILKTNNGSADINLSITSATLTAIVGTDPDGDVTTPSYQYQWQSLAKTGAEWMDIEGATDASYTISDDETSAEYRVQVMYTDGQGYQEMLTSKGIRHTLPGSGLKIRIKVFLEGPLR